MWITPFFFFFFLSFPPRTKYRTGSLNRKVCVFLTPFGRRVRKGPVRNRRSEGVKGGGIVGITGEKKNRHCSPIASFVQSVVEAFTSQHTEMRGPVTGLLSPTGPLAQSWPATAGVNSGHNRNCGATAWRNYPLQRRFLFVRLPHPIPIQLPGLLRPCGVPFLLQWLDLVHSLRFAVLASRCTESNADFMIREPDRLELRFIDNFNHCKKYIYFFNF